MGEYLQQVGVAGILVILVLDRVFAFIKTQRIGREPATDAGSQSTDYWRKATRESAQDAIDASTTPILRQLADILGRLESRSAGMYDMSVRQGYVIDDVTKSIERLRVSSHIANDHLQKIVAKVSETS